MQSRPGYALSYVKVEIHSRSPRLWGWALHRDGSDNLLRRSEGGYRCAEDAWKAGRLAHARYEAEALRSLLPTEEEPAEEEEELAC
jgi:hypothetical protein